MVDNNTSNNNNNNNNKNRRRGPLRGRFFFDFLGGGRQYNALLGQPLPVGATIRPQCADDAAELVAPAIGQQAGRAAHVLRPHLRDAVQVSLALRQRAVVGVVEPATEQSRAESGGIGGTVNPSSSSPPPNLHLRLRLRLYHDHHQQHRSPAHTMCGIVTAHRHSTRSPRSQHTVTRSQHTVTAQPAYTMCDIVASQALSTAPHTPTAAHLPLLPSAAPEA